MMTPPGLKRAERMAVFVRERAEEIASTARAVGGGQWQPGYLNYWSDWQLGHSNAVLPGDVVLVQGRHVETIAACRGDVDHASNLADHIAAWDPAQALRTADSMMILLDAWSSARRKSERNMAMIEGLARQPAEHPTDHTRAGRLRAEGWMLEGKLLGLATALQLEALKWDRHPDWVREWCPEWTFEQGFCACHPTPEEREALVRLM